MACGNNHVSRASLSSKPESPLQHLAKLFDKTPRPPSKGDPRGAQSSGAKSRQVGNVKFVKDQEGVGKTSDGFTAERTSDREWANTKDEISIKTGSGKEIKVEQKFSDIRKDGSVHRFLDSNRNETLNSQFHIHEILKEDGSVSMHITDRRDGEAAKHTAHEELRPVSGNDVNAAEARLAAIMQTMKE